MSIFGALSGHRVVDCSPGFTVQEETGQQAIRLAEMPGQRDLAVLQEAVAAFKFAGHLLNTKAIAAHQTTISIAVALVRQSAESWSEHGVYRFLRYDLCSVDFSIIKEHLDQYLHFVGTDAQTALRTEETAVGADYIVIQRFQRNGGLKIRIGDQYLVRILRDTAVVVNLSDIGAVFIPNAVRLLLIQRGNILDLIGIKCSCAVK